VTTPDDKAHSTSTPPSFSILLWFTKLLSPVFFDVQRLALFTTQTLRRAISEDDKQIERSAAEVATYFIVSCALVCIALVLYATVAETGITAVRQLPGIEEMVKTYIGSAPEILTHPDVISVFVLLRNLLLSGVGCVAAIYVVRATLRVTAHWKELVCQCSAALLGLSVVVFVVGTVQFVVTSVPNQTFFDNKAFWSSTAFAAMFAIPPIFVYWKIRRTSSSKTSQFSLRRAAATLSVLIFYFAPAFVFLNWLFIPPEQQKFFSSFAEDCREEAKPKCSFIIQPPTRQKVHASQFVVTVFADHQPEGAHPQFIIDINSASGESGVLLASGEPQRAYLVPLEPTRRSHSSDCKKLRELVVGMPQAQRSASKIHLRAKSPSLLANALSGQPLWRSSGVALLSPYALTDWLHTQCHRREMAS
jgi:hypothetical protein